MVPKSKNETENLHLIDCVRHKFNILAAAAALLEFSWQNTWEAAGIGDK